MLACGLSGNPFSHKLVPLHSLALSHAYHLDMTEMLFKTDINSLVIKTFVFALIIFCPAFNSFSLTESSFLSKYNNLKKERRLHPESSFPIVRRDTCILRAVVP